MSEELIYLASPYSHPTPAVRHDRFKQACLAAGRMMESGILVFSPIAHTHPIAEICRLPGGWEYWERYDRAMLLACEKLVVLRLSGWEESVGVAAEIKIMKEMGKPVEYIDAD